MRRFFINIFGWFVLLSLLSSCDYKCYPDIDLTKSVSYSTQTNTKVVSAKSDEWVDTGEDRDPDFNPEKYERMGKTARNRGKVKKRTIECHVCGRSFQVNPSLVHGEYVRCNRCTGR